MDKRLLLDGWEDINEEIRYNEKLGLYAKNGKIRDKLAAQWAGWIGPGAALKKQIKEVNKREE